MSSKIVYFDKKYPTSWTKNICKKASEWLSEQDFAVLGAVPLRSWMKERISKKTAQESVVIFANYIIPNTVFEDGTPNILVRKYLDNGGRVIWMGDIPFWYQGFPEKFDLSKDTAYKSIAYLGVLGVNFTLAIPSQPIQLTPEAREMGLKTEWYGIRPTSIERNKVKQNFFLSNPCTFKPLGTSKTIFVRHFFNKKASWLHRIGNINLGFGGFGGGLSVKQPEKDEVEWNKDLVNSFKVVFDESHPNQGFIRIWDFPLNEIDEIMLNELKKIAEHDL